MKEMSPPKVSQASRKLPGAYADRLNVNWKSNNSSKCTRCNKFHKDNHSGDESQLPEAKTSDESLSGAISDDNTEGPYSPEADSQSVDYPYENQHQRKNIKVDAETVLADLKELQWRRDALERYYTNGVRKIINDYFFANEKFPNDQQKIPGLYQERMRAGGVKKSQPYGVRLNCGCYHVCERIRQKSPLQAMPSTSGAANYVGDSRGRCPSRSEAVRTS